MSAWRCPALGIPSLPCRLTHLCEFCGANEPKLLCPPARKHYRSAGAPGAWEGGVKG